MNIKNKKKEAHKGSKESDIYEKLNVLSSDQLKKLFIHYLKDNLEKISTDLAYSLKKETSIPDTIFNKKLTILESIVKYLKENLGHTLKDISTLIGRDQRNVWSIYHSSIKKYKENFEIKDHQYLLPISIFANRKLSILENAVFYLKSKFDLSYHKIALIIHRDDRTVWTVYQKAKRKYEEKQ